MVADSHNFPLLAELLAEQQQLQTPVTRFADAKTSGATPALAPVYRDLIPLTAPRAGEQYAFEVDLDSCTGCKACVSGCHAMNGLDEHETWRDVGVVLGGDAASPFQQTITSACHHCADPACLNGCPVLAYEKDPLTGIVRHLDDQCIGCSYCVLKCPYDVPKFNARLGIVRKCDLCQGRLAVGEAPACVQACPTHAIRIVTVATTLSAPSPDMADAGANDRPGVPVSCAVALAENVTYYVTSIRKSDMGFLPESVAAGTEYTRPTTRYLSKRPLPATLSAGDAGALRVQPAHGALVLLLVLSQVGLGLLAALALAPGAVRATAGVGWLGLALVFTGLATGVAHLGQPLRAWRVFLGWRRSWLSREAILFGAAAGPLGAYAASLLALGRDDGLGEAARRFGPLCLQGGGGLGLLGVLCSAMIYIDTRRQFWAPSRTAVRMGGTVLIAGLLVLEPAAAAAALGLKLVAEAVALRGDGVSARLLRGPLRASALARLGAGLAGAAVVAWVPLGWGVAVFAAGEWMERGLYFRAVDAPKMPGVAAGGVVPAEAHA